MKYGGKLTQAAVGRDSPDWGMRPSSLLAAAFEQMAAEHERRRAVKRQQLRRKAWAGMLACAVGALLAIAYWPGWPGIVAGLISVAGYLSAIAAVLRHRRTR